MGGGRVGSIILVAFNAAGRVSAACFLSFRGERALLHGLRVDTGFAELPQRLICSRRPLTMARVFGQSRHFILENPIAFLR